jgi:hypothetical protein
MVSSNDGGCERSNHVIFGPELIQQFELKREAIQRSAVGSLPRRYLSGRTKRMASGQSY